MLSQLVQMLVVKQVDHIYCFVWEARWIDRLSDLKTRVVQTICQRRNNCSNVVTSQACSDKVIEHFIVISNVLQGPWGELKSQELLQGQPDFAAISSRVKLWQQSSTVSQVHPHSLHHCPA